MNSSGPLRGRKERSHGHVQIEEGDGREEKVMAKIISPLNLGGTLKFGKGSKGCACSKKLGGGRK